MLKYEQNIKNVKEILKIQRYYDSINGLLGWDLWQGLPADGRSYREEVGGYFTKEAFKILTDRETVNMVSYFKELEDEKYKNEYDKGAARVLVKRYERAVKVPIDLQVEMNSFCSRAQIVWKEALNKSDFNMYKPYLQEMFRLKTKIAQSIDKTKNPFDVLVNEVDEGLGVEKIEQLFSELKVAIVHILGQAKEKNFNIDKKFLNADICKDIIRKISTKISEETFFDNNKGTYSEVIHPVCYGIGPEDVRITTYFQSLFPSIFSVLHECGHGIYNYSSNEKSVEYGIWGGLSGAMHESQSRFYENIIGKSKEFWHHYLPLLQQEIKEFQNIELNTLYNSINKVEPTLKRIDADELTYSLHPIIRFEMEKEYFDGKLKTDDFNDAWNAKYKEYLGIEPKNAKEGVLQDVHWASGHVGYFQSYTLGNIYGGQFRDRMLKDIPDLYEQISLGDFKELNKWNYENIHQYGNLYTPNELIVKATGEELQSKYFINYLTEKFI